MKEAEAQEKHPGHRGGFVQADPCGLACGLYLGHAAGALATQPETRPGRRAVWLRVGCGSRDFVIPHMFTALSGICRGLGAKQLQNP